METAGVWRLPDGDGYYASALNDPLGRIGYLQSELFRAARIVVDTGLHHKRWTREQAVAWMVAEIGETPEATQREVDRCASILAKFYPLEAIRHGSAVDDGGAFVDPLSDAYAERRLQAKSAEMSRLSAIDRAALLPPSRSLTTCSATNVRKLSASFHRAFSSSTA